MCLAHPQPPVLAEGQRRWLRVVGQEPDWADSDVESDAEENVELCRILKENEQMRKILWSLEDFSLSEAVLKDKINAAEGCVRVGVPSLQPPPKGNGKKGKGSKPGRKRNQR